MWAAKKGLEALKIDWNEGPYARDQFESIWDDLRAASEKDGAVANRSATCQGPGDGRQIRSVLRDAVAGACADGAAERHGPRQARILRNLDRHPGHDAGAVRAAKAAGLPVEKVTVHNHLLGGGFGRRLEPDMVVAAVRIAKQVDGPVKVVWTREEDIQHDIYRPVYRDTIAATLSTARSPAGNTGSPVRR